MVKSWVLATTCLGIAASACSSRKTKDGENTSHIASVTVKQPDLRKRMDGPATDAEKDLLISNLVFKVSTKASDCDAGVIPEDKSWDEKPLSDASVDSSYKVKKGCHYIFSLVYRDKVKGDEILRSDGITKNMSKEELTKASPIAAVLLYATDAGKKYFLGTGPIPTSELKDVSVEPEVSKSGGSGSATPPPSAGTFASRMPACAQNKVTVLKDGAECLEKARLALVSESRTFNGKSWQAAFETTLNRTFLISTDISTEFSRASFCSHASIVGSNLARANLATCKVDCSPAEAQFKSDAASFLKSLNDLRVLEMLALGNCV